MGLAFGAFCLIRISVFTPTMVKAFQLTLSIDKLNRSMACGVARRGWPLLRDVWAERQSVPKSLLTPNCAHVNVPTGQSWEFGDEKSVIGGCVRVTAGR